MKWSYIINITTKRHCMTCFKTLIRNIFKKKTTFEAVWLNAYLCRKFHKDLKLVMFVDEQLKNMHFLKTKIKFNGIWL